MIEYIQLLRPLQWLKNMFVFAPIFFSNNLLKPEFFWPTLVVFAAFCLVSSSIYCFNDLRDVEADRQHPKKCHRPIASGKVSIKGSPNTPYLFMVVVGYWLMNLAYCIRLKQIAILDVSIIAVGFVMRVLAGGLTTDIWISHWLVMMTFLVTLFLAFTKRNDNYRIYEQTGTKPRVSITGYNKTFINEATAIIASVTLVCYIMYTMSPEVIQRMGIKYFYLTGIWVLVGILCYLPNIKVYQHTESPTMLVIKECLIQQCFMVWLLSFFAITNIKYFIKWFLNNV